MFWINGERCDVISLSDRALQFGDGCFTTAYILDGHIVWLKLHLQRLQQDAQRLFLPPLDWYGLECEIRSAVASLAQGVLKVIISRGSGGRGYSTSACQQPTRILILSAYPPHYECWREQGVVLRLSPIPLARNPWLAGIKHLNRLEQILIRAYLDDSNADEALVLDTHGLLVECCAANLFWRKGRKVFTPSLQHAGVNGIMRKHIISCLDDSPYDCHITTEPVTTLADADEVIICNALMPIVPVVQAHQWRYFSRSLYNFLTTRGGGL